MGSDFFTSLGERSRAIDSLLCVGLDPVLVQDDVNAGALILERCKRIVGETSGATCAYKPNMAFFEAYGSRGLEALERVLEIIPTEIPVILDAKRCDIGNTAEAYAASLFGHFKADAVTLSPYMGRDAVDPFLKHGGKGLFVLARTSNPGAKVFQDIDVGGEPLYLRVARDACSWSERVGLVVAGNDPVALERIRLALPQAWFLSPGIGAQGGDAGTAAKAGLRADGLGMLVVAVRAVCEVPDPKAAAVAFRDQIRVARDLARK